MDSKCNSLKSQFNDLGFTLTENILEKCMQLCIDYNIDEETVVEMWTAFSLTNLNGSTPTIEALLQMERKELKKTDKNLSNTNISHQLVSPHLPSKNVSYNKMDTEIKRRHQDTPKADICSHVTINKTPLGEDICTNESTISNSSFSPIRSNILESPPAQINSGNVVAEFLPKGLRKWTAKYEVSLSVSSYNDDCLSSNCKVMREPLSKKADVLNNNLEHIGKCLIKKNSLQEPSCNYQVSPTDVVCVGRVCCDSNEHLNPSSVMLEGSRNLCLGQCVILDLSRLSHYSLFPGQIVAVVGTNVTGHRFLVKRLFCSTPLPLPSNLPSFGGTIDIVIAAGPFTHSENFTYEPLAKLMTYVKNHKPHILILIGPFMCVKSAQCANGSMTETYSILFQRVLNGIIDQLKGSWTQIIIVSSNKDAVCLPVYPTPAVCNSNYTTLHCFSDPCMISINGIIIGLTATDSLMHLGKEEISYPDGRKNLLGRVASYLLDQQSFYPLYPPNEELSVDLEMLDFFANLEVTPHLLIVPSNFRCFIKELRGCLLLNPKQLVKADHFGTFARLEVDPPANNTWAPSTHISAQILEL